MTRLWNWYYEESGIFLKSHGNRKWDVAPFCPICGMLTDYWEGQIDQDFMGNDIHGWNYTCYRCGVGTEVEELARYDG